MACDSYHRYKEDVAIAKELNMKSYRFSVSWPRIQADGTGKPNEKGLDYYKRLAVKLHHAGIRPLATLFHWDLPQALQDKGGWPNRDMVGRFTDYAEIVTRSLGDRVDHWAIFNEPWVFTMLGYAWQAHVPGHKDVGEFLRASHVVNLCQGQGFPCYQGRQSQIAGGHRVQHDALSTRDGSLPRISAAAERAHALANTWFLDTALKGTYPAAFPNGNPLEAMGVKPGDMELVKAPLDFSGSELLPADHRCQRSRYGGPIPTRAGTLGLKNTMEALTGVKTDMGWEVWPDGFYALLMRVTRDYNKPVIEITENGSSYLDAPDVARGGSRPS